MASDRSPSAGSSSPGTAATPAPADERPAPGIETGAVGNRAAILERYATVRDFTEELCEPLAVEDYVVQTMENVSPTKWHLAHVSWFFETFLLKPFLDGYRPLNDAYAYLFNSYYVRAGERHCRDRRGWITRPTVEEVYAYREHVDRHMRRLVEEVDAAELDAEVGPRLEIGLHHEQQHQELLLTDIKHVFGVNPLRPAYREDAASAEGEAADLRWVDFEGGLVEIGHEGDGFCFDNETPRHREYLEPYRLANRLVTCGDYLEFIEDDGYARPELWLSDGWAAVQERSWTEPFYWERKDGRWRIHTLGGPRELRPDEPVCHLTYLEADAFARWAGARLPTEAEWEAAAREQPIRGNFVDGGVFHPLPASGEADGPLHQVFGDVWEWTRSQYSPYPGYEPLPGALGEYNGKFMCDQFVLRGGSCATSRSHVRATYRNFFHADEAWQFTGLRLANDA